jgi:TniQ
VFEHGLSGRLWPIHSKPYDDEVLSSWLVRLSRAYGAEPTCFCAQIWPHRALWSRDIARGTHPKLLRVLTAKTATPRTRVLATTVRGYRGYSTEDLRYVKRQPWLLRLGLRALTRSRPWLQYCPRCLREDADPYFRRCWRLAFVTVCPDHNRRLLDRCEACGAVVNLHRLPGDAETMTQCHDCRDDLRGAQAPILGRSATSHRLVRCQTFLLQTMRIGWCRLWGPSTIQGALFFGVLHRRVRVFLTTRRAPAFREVFGTDGPGAM